MWSEIKNWIKTVLCLVQEACSQKVLSLQKVPLQKTKVRTINISVSAKWDQYIFMSLSSTLESWAEKSTQYKYILVLFGWILGTFGCSPACKSVCLRLAKSRSHTIDKRQQQTRWANEYKFAFCVLAIFPREFQPRGCKTGVMRFRMSGDARR